MQKGYLIMIRSNKDYEDADYLQAVEDLKLLNGELFYDELKITMKQHVEKIEEKYYSSINNLDDMTKSINRLPGVIEDKMQEELSAVKVAFQEVIDEFNSKMNNEYFAQLSEQDVQQRDLLQQILTEYHNFTKDKVEIIAEQIVRIEQQNASTKQSIEMLINKLDVFIEENKREQMSRHRYIVWQLIVISIGIVGLIIFAWVRVDF